MSRAKWIKKNYPKAATPQPLLLCFPSSDSKIRTNSGCRQTVQKTCSAQGMSNLRVLSGRVSWYDVTEEDFCLPPALLSALSCPVCTPCFMSQSEVLVLVCQEQTPPRKLHRRALQIATENASGWLDWPCERWVSSSWTTSQPRACAHAAVTVTPSSCPQAWTTRAKPTMDARERT